MTMRTALILDRLDVPVWQSRAIEHLVQSNATTIETVVLTGHPHRPRVGKLRSRIVEFLMGKSSVDESPESDACVIVNVEKQIGCAEIIVCSEKGTDKSSTNLKALVDDLESRDIDLVVALSQIDYRRWLPQGARFGLWYFQHGGNFSQNTSCADIGLCEVLKRKPYLRSKLKVCHSSLAQDGIAYQSWSAVNPMSLRKTRDEHLWKVSSFVERSIRKARKAGAVEFVRMAQDAKPFTEPRKSSRERRLSQILLLVYFLQYVLWRSLRKFQRLFFSEQWALLTDMNNKGYNFGNCKTIQRSSEHLWADPHVVYRDGKYYVFIEEVPPDTERGHIAVLTVSADGRWSTPKTVLERPYHLSYPFLFEWENYLYMIPESAENRSIELYKCLEFPSKWEFGVTLMRDVSAFDATLFHFNGKWWMFANVKEQDTTSSWDELHLFYSDRPVSTDWVRHPCNPIVSDVRYARPAGKIFEEDGRIYRPSQDSSYRYGYGLNINEIVELTTSVYREIPVRKIEPDWSRSIKGVHTFSRIGDLTVIDGIVRSRRR